jgi:prolipoprotein diacylglyceryl transferase
MSQSIAFFGVGVPTIYWHGIFFAAAIAVTVLFTLIFRLLQGKKAAGIGLFILLSFPLAMILSRLYYYFFSQQKYASTEEIFTLSTGGFALYGAMAGVVLSAFLVSRILRKNKFSELLDAAAPASALGIAIGRTAAYFTGEGLGGVVENPSFQKLPFSIFSEGENNWFIAVFAFEAIFAALIFIYTSILLIGQYVKPARRFKSGDIFLNFILLYAGGQTLFESLRTDALFLNSLGFVKVSQLVSAILLVAAVVTLSVRHVRLEGFKKWYIIAWAALVGMITASFIMEYRMTAGMMVTNYSVMGISLAGVTAWGAYLFYVIWNSSGSGSHRRRLK